MPAIGAAANIHISPDLDSFTPSYATQRQSETSGGAKIVGTHKTTHSFYISNPILYGILIPVILWIV